MVLIHYYYCGRLNLLSITCISGFFAVMVSLRCDCSALSVSSEVKRQNVDVDGLMDRDA